MVFINATGIIGQALINYSNNVTGSLALTLLIVALILIVIMLVVFKMSFELTSLVILPYLLTCWAYTSDFAIFGGVTLIYMAILFIKNFWIQ